MYDFKLAVTMVTLNGTILPVSKCGFLAPGARSKIGTPFPNHHQVCSAKEAPVNEGKCVKGYWGLGDTDFVLLLFSNLFLQLKMLKIVRRSIIGEVMSFHNHFPIYHELNLKGHWTILKIFFLTEFHLSCKRWLLVNKYKKKNSRSPCFKTCTHWGWG